MIILRQMGQIPLKQSCYFLINCTSPMQPHVQFVTAWMSLDRFPASPEKHFQQQVGWWNWLECHKFLFRHNSEESSKISLTGISHLAKVRSPSWRRKPVSSAYQPSPPPQNALYCSFLNIGKPQTLKTLSSLLFFSSKNRLFLFMFVSVPCDPRWLSYH